MPRHSQNRETRRTRLDEFGTDSADTQESTILRAAAHGQFIGGAGPAPRSPGYRSNKGRYVGYEIDEHDPVRRDPATGRIRSMAAAEPVPRPEQVERFGEPDSGDSAPRGREMVDPTGTMEFGRMSEADEITARAASADVSLAPDEVLDDVGRVGTTALGGNVLGQGERRATELDDDRPPETALQQQSQIVGGGGETPFAQDASTFDVQDPDTLADVYDTGFDQTTPDDDRGVLDETAVDFETFGREVEAREQRFAGALDTTGATMQVIEDARRGDPAEVFGGGRR